MGTRLGQGGTLWPLTASSVTLQLLGGLDKEERRLFHDRIRQLDRSVLPATHTLTWASPKHALDFYFREANLCGPPSCNCETAHCCSCSSRFFTCCMRLLSP